MAVEHAEQSTFDIAVLLEVRDSTASENVLVNIKVASV